MNHHPDKFGIKVLAGGEMDLGPVPGKLCVYAHFDPRGVVADYVHLMLKKLKGSGFAILFLSTAPDLRSDHMAQLEDTCWIVARRRNWCLDIGAWAVGAHWIERVFKKSVGDCEQLLLTNDTVFGPLRPLDPIFEKMYGRELDLWGITDSEVLAPHVQSYFLVLDRRGPAFFSRWIRNFEFLDDRLALIRRYEVGLSEAARAAGLRIGAWISYSDLKDYSRNHPDRLFPTVLEKLRAREGRVNPTHAFWRECLRDFGSPFIKRDLLRNYENFDDAGPGWEAVVENLQTDYPIDYIRDQLADDLSRPLSRAERIARDQKFSTGS